MNLGSNENMSNEGMVKNGRTGEAVRTKNRMGIDEFDEVLETGKCLQMKK